VPIEDVEAADLVVVRPLEQVAGAREELGVGLAGDGIGRGSGRDSRGLRWRSVLVVLGERGEASGEASGEAVEGSAGGVEASASADRNAMIRNTGKWPPMACPPRTTSRVRRSTYEE